MATSAQAITASVNAQERRAGRPDRPSGFSIAENVSNRPGVRAMVTAVPARLRIAAYTTPHHRAEGRRPFGNSSGNPIAVRPTTGTHIQLRAHAAAVPHGKEPGRVTVV